jgi:hypothetical protein
MPTLTTPKIYYVPATRPGRAYHLIQQGLRNNTHVNLVDRPDRADYIFYHYQAFSPQLAFDPRRLVFIDYEDSPLSYFPIQCRAYFKRSWVAHYGPAQQRQAIARPVNVFPIAYAIMDEFVVAEPLERDIDFGCYLRPNQNLRVRLLAIAATIKAPRKSVGPVNASGRSVFDREYLSMLRRSKIVLTANPDFWEGDSRTWEALANGALVIVDRMFTPQRFPLVDQKHLIEFDRNDLGSLTESIEYYVNHLEEAARIATAGHMYAMQHHRAQHRIDDILEVLGLPA